MELKSLIKTICQSVLEGELEAREEVLNKIVNEANSNEATKTIGNIEIDGPALMPVDFLIPAKLAKEYPIWFEEKDGTIQARLTGRKGKQGKLVIEWQRSLSPEALSLVRVNTEHNLKDKLHIKKG